MRRGRVAVKIVALHHLDALEERVVAILEVERVLVLLANARVQVPIQVDSERVQQVRVG